MEWVILLAALVVVGIVLYSVQSISRRQDELSRMMSQTVSDQNRTFIEALQKNSSEMGQRLEHASEVIGNVQKSIGEFSEIGKTIKELQDYIASPKLRGNLGEHILAETLKQMLPRELYALQYSFPGGETVDALIRLQEESIPVDAKFPITNFKAMHQVDTESEKKTYEKLFVKDVLKHIGDIARKYIRTDQHTVDYAIMYIPSEAVFYEAIMHETIQEAARQRRVVMVSPSTFHAFLRAVLMSLQGIRIQQEAKEILAILASSKQEYGKISDALSTLDRHLSNAYNQLQQVNKFFVQLGQRLTKANTISLDNGKEQKELS